MTSAKIKGKIFEWFIKTILLKCGFTEVPVDNFLIYNRGQERMIHGLAQPHDADVLMYPPIQIPFYFPSRFLVECKAYKDKIGLPVARNLLGLREDINHFEIVTEETLKARRNYRRTNMAMHDHDRYLYQTALAALNEVKLTAQEFAIVHKIPIISFYSSARYKFLLDFIASINEANKDQIWDNFILCTTNENSSEIDDNDLTLKFIKDTKTLADHMFIAVTDNGTILLLYSETTSLNLSHGRNLAEIHWQTTSSEWVITSQNSNHPFNLSFELPGKIYNTWADQKFDRLRALKIKEKYFTRIVLFNKIDGEVVVNVIHLDNEFIRRAKTQLNN